MATIRNVMVLDDRMTPVLKNIVTAMNQVVEVVNRMNNHLNRSRTAMQNFNSTSLNAASSSLAKAAQGAQKLEESVNKVGNAGQRAGNKLDSAFNLVRLWAAYNIFSMIAERLKSVFTSYDEFISASARLNLINDGMRDYKQMQEDVLAVANRTRSSYEGTARIISMIGLSGSTAFKTTSDVLKFSELFNKTTVISGLGKEQQAAVQLQLAQGLSSGKLQGDEFRTISEQAPVFKSMLAQGLGVSVGQLRTMSREGQLTAEKINEAMLKMGDKINKMFNEMPWTFGQAVQVMNNNLQWSLQYIEPIMKRLTQHIKDFALWLKTPDGVKTITLLVAVFSSLLTVIEDVARPLGWFFNLLIQNSDVVIPFLIFVSTFFTLYQAINKVILAWMAYEAAAKVVKEAQVALNIAMMANPIMLITIAILGLIAVFIYLWNTSLQFRITWINLCTNMQLYFVNASIAIIAAVRNIANAIMDVMSMINPMFKLASDMGGRDFVNKGLDSYMNFYLDSYDKIKLAGNKAVQNEMDWQTARDILEKLKVHPTPGTGLTKGLGTPSNPMAVKGHGGKIGLEKDDVAYLKDIAMKEFIVNYRQISPQVTANFGDVHREVDVQYAIYEMLRQVEEASKSSLKSGVGSK